MSSQSNSFLDGPLGPIYVRTALPIIFVMGMNGALAVVDALFLGPVRTKGLKTARFFGPHDVFRNL